MNKTITRILAERDPAYREVINQYKRQDVFRCTHEAHRHFDSTVSVYHVLKQKKCFPDGCIYFEWRCRKLNKGQPCPRKYKHVGRSCASCRYYYDNKVIRRPQVLLSETAFRTFLSDLQAFESWVDEHDGKMVEVSGTVNSVKPRLRISGGNKKARPVFEGFLLNIFGGSVGRSVLNDLLYLPVSSRRQVRYRFGKGDEIICSGYFSLQAGMPVLSSVRGIELLRRGEPSFWTESRARVALSAGSFLPYQSQQCHRCERGVLVGCVDGDCMPGEGARRRMFCLEGVRDPQECRYGVMKRMAER